MAVSLNTERKQKDVIGFLFGRHKYQRTCIGLLVYIYGKDMCMQIEGQSDLSERHHSGRTPAVLNEDDINQFDSFMIQNTRI